MNAGQSMPTVGSALSQAQPSASRFAALYRGMSTPGMALADAQGRVLDANAELERMFGYMREDLQGQPLELLLAGNWREAHAAMRRHFRRAPNAPALREGYELFGRHRDGGELPLLMCLNYLHGAGGPMVLALFSALEQRAAPGAGAGNPDPSFKTAA